MTYYSNGGFFNPAFHDSETLEIDKRPSRKPNHSNPYARVEQAWQGGRTDLVHPSMDRGGMEAPSRGGRPWEGWQQEVWGGGGSIPLGHLPRHPESPPWQPELNQSTFQTHSAAHYDRSASIRFPSDFSGHSTLRFREMTMRRMSVFAGGDPAHLSFTEDAIRTEIENEERDLVEELVSLSTRDRIRAVRELPMSFEEKKHIRSQVLAFKSSKQSRHFSCFRDCSENVSLSFRRCGSNIGAARQTLELWQGTMKEVGGSFGTSVLSYFLFLKWLLMFNVFSFLVNFGFLTIPLLIYDHTPQIPQNVTFRGLEILTGAGYFNYTVMYYGGYSNKSMAGLLEYNMQLAYFFTIAAYMMLCGASLIYSMASSFKRNYMLADPLSGGAWQLLCSWDFSVTNERALRQRKNNLRVQLKESLSEKAQRELLTTSERFEHFGIHLGSWVFSTSLAIGCAAAIYFLSQFEQQRTADASNPSALREAETLLVPFVVSLINLVVPLLFSLFNKFEHYSNQRRQIYALIVRNVILKMSILGILCYFWMNEVATKFSCWESMVGQALYRLVVTDFLFLMLGSFFGEFLSNVIGTRFLPRLGVPEFDVARNVLDLIYAQTLAWIGVYFSPLLPVIQIIKFFILFYLKKVSLTQNCQPPKRSGRAAQMQTIFIALLFFPSFVGSLSIVAYTVWSLEPSEQCGPFQGLNHTFGAVSLWVEELEGIPGSVWAVWVYHNVIRSEIFYFLVTIIILFITYLYWQVTQGRKLLIVLLRQQIVHEGKDKSFLLEKIQTLQKSPAKQNSRKGNQRKQTKQRSGIRSSSNGLVQTFLARRSLEELEDGRGCFRDPPVPADISAYNSTSASALTQAMAARQRVESEYDRTPAFPATPLDGSPFFAAGAQVRSSYRHKEEEEEEVEEEYYRRAGASDYTAPSTSIMMQVMEARRRAEEEEEDVVRWRPAHQNSAPAGSSALIQAMLARQRAQNEYDDGY